MKRRIAIVVFLIGTISIFVFKLLGIPKTQLNQQCLVQLGIAFEEYIDAHQVFPDGWHSMIRAKIIAISDGDNYTDRHGHALFCVRSVSVHWDYKLNRRHLDEILNGSDHVEGKPLTFSETWNETSMKQLLDLVNERITERLVRSAGASSLE